MVEFPEMKSLMTPLFYYSGNSLDVSERLIWSNWQSTIHDGYKDYYRQNTLSLPRRQRKRMVWKMSRIKNKFFQGVQWTQFASYWKKKLKERKKKQTRLYVALHFNLFTPRTIYERFEGGNDPRSWINDLSGWKETTEKFRLGQESNADLCDDRTRRSRSIKLIKPTGDRATHCEVVIYPVVKMTWMKIDGMTHTLSCG